MHFAALPKVLSSVPYSMLDVGCESVAVAPRKPGIPDVQYLLRSVKCFGASSLCTVHELSVLLWFDVSLQSGWLDQRIQQSFEPPEIGAEKVGSIYSMPYFATCLSAVNSSINIGRVPFSSWPRTARHLVSSVPPTKAVFLFTP